MVMRRNASAMGMPCFAPTCFARSAKAVPEFVELTDLALVLSQRGDLLVDAFANVNPMIGLGRAPEQYFPDLVRF